MPSARGTVVITDVSDGPAGPRGAGWWYFDAGSQDLSGVDTTAEVNIFWDAVHDPDIDPIVDDVFVIYTSHSSGTQSFIYNGVDWTPQAAFVDGNLLVAGTVRGQAIAAQTITGNNIQAGTIEADNLFVQSLESVSATLGKVFINESLNLEAAGAGLIAGRSSISDYATNGFYIGRELRPGGSVGFEVSHTSTNPSNNRIQGVIHNDDENFTIYNPTIKYGGSASGGQTFYASSGTFNLGQANQLTIAVAGGGGGGGGGRDDGYLSNVFASNGGVTTVTFRDGSPSGPVIASYSAAGGTGGASAISGSRSGTSGIGTVFGPGGTGGGSNQAGSSGTGYGSGGGGAGGDSPSTFDSSGGSGYGGTAAEVKNFTFNTNTANSIYMVVQIGAGGAGGSASVNYLGGSGAPGVVAVSSPLGGTYSVNYRAPMILSSQVLASSVGAVTWANLSGYDFVILHGHTNIWTSSSSPWYLQASTNGVTWVSLKQLGTTSVVSDRSGTTYTHTSFLRGDITISNFNYRVTTMPQLNSSSQSTSNIYSFLRITTNGQGTVNAGSKLTLLGGFYDS